MIFCFFTQTIYALSELKAKENATKALSNTYGDYYGVDINSDAPITVDIPIEEAGTSFTSTNPIHFEDDDAGLIPTEDGYVYEEPVDEFASVLCE
ncbi:MAG: hypothetical protein LBR25_00855 [Erysipelotrichaceae bacterium]|nr:hypothetical protein [Erysipelotrichaceae bacterium]